MDKSSETGKVLIRVHKSNGAAAAGTALTEIATGGDADSPQVACFGPYITAASEGVIASKYWPITAQAPCIFDFNQLIGRPFKVVGGKGIAVTVDTVHMSATAASLFTVTLEGEE